MPFISSVRGSFGPQGRQKGKVGRLLAATGGIVTTAGGYRIHTFTSVGTQVFEADGNGQVDVLVVAGGGSGGPGQPGYWEVGAGGGAGGLLYSSSVSVTEGPVTVIVGDGGLGKSGNSPYDPGLQGENSRFGSIIATGGGGGGANYSTNPGYFAAYLNGGSGGGAQGNFPTVGTGIPGQGNNGGASHSQQDSGKAGGGGGAGATGGNANSGAGGNGGSGLSNSISGTSIVYAGGGGGSNASNGGGSNGSGGSGGGGSGGGGYGTDGLGGGGGGNKSGARSGDGGSGVVIVRYPI